MKTDFVILAAGNGTRLWPLNETTPKCLVRICKKPLIERIIERIYDQAEKILVIIGDKKDQVIENFANSRFKDKIIFIEQVERKGTGHAILMAEKESSSEFFFVLNADTFAEKRFFEEMLEAAASKNRPLIVGVKSNDAKRFGVLEVENGVLKNFAEKPENVETGIINTGAYYLPKKFFEYLKAIKVSKRGEIEATDAILEFARVETLNVIEFQGYWNDIGYYWNFLDATQFALENELAEKIEPNNPQGTIKGTIEPNVSINGTLHLGKGSIVKNGCRFEGNVFIGENCIIGPNAFVTNSTIEDNCVVGSASEIKRSVLMNNSKLPHLNYIGDSVIGENCNFGAGSKIANLRFDEKEILVEAKGKKIRTYHNKLGAAIGSNTKLGINVSINCGTLIGSNCRIVPNTFVKRNVDSNKIVKA